MLVYKYYQQTYHFSENLCVFKTMPLSLLLVNIYRLLYSWLYNTELYLDKWTQDQIYFGIVQSTV